jgi:hypothetical protein
MSGRLFDEFKEKMDGANEEKDPEAVGIAELKQLPRRPENKPIARLHVVEENGDVRSFQYFHLDSGSKFVGNGFTLVFVGAKHYEVKVEGYGPKLWSIYDYCCLHRWRLLVAVHRGIAPEDKDATVLTKIKVTDITPRERE